MLLNYVFVIIFIIALGIIYQKYLEKESYKSPNAFYGYDDIRKYLLDEHSFADNKKPIMWVHIPFEYNSRNWSSFGSRSSFDLNQPYLHLTVRSIIKHCDKSFKICIIDDSSFQKLIPGWNINLGQLSDPMLSYVRQLGLTKLIYQYGGMVTPLSFLCFKDLIHLYDIGTSGQTMFICENIDNNITSTSYLYYPDIRFMGAVKETPIVQECINFMERTISHDYTAQAEFLGEFDRWCNARINAKTLRLIPGTEIGIKTVTQEPVTIERLLGDDYIQFYPNMYGIWVPDKAILKRVSYGWFTRMNAEQIFESNFVLAKCITLAMGFDDGFRLMEGMRNRPDWISFWRVPLQAPVWGPMPQNLGNDVPRKKY